MKLFELVGLFTFIFFVTNCLQFEKARKICAETNYESQGCEVHKKIYENSKKRLKITFE
jgi:hypothetical protein